MAEARLLGLFVDPFAAGARSSGIDEALIKFHTDYYFELALKPSTREEDIIGLLVNMRQLGNSWLFYPDDDYSKRR